MKTGFKLLLIAGLLANAAGFAQAQNTSAPATAHAMDHSRSMHGRMDPTKMQAMVAKRLADLKAKLNITASQESAWATFAAAMTPPPRMDLTRVDRAEIDKLTTPERIDKMRPLRTQRLMERQAQMDKRDDAIKTFYAALNVDQKKVLDTEHSKLMHRWGDRKGHGPHH